MKTLTQAKKNTWITVLTVFCGCFILNSCISNTNKNDKSENLKKAPESNIEARSCSINESALHKWDIIRKQPDRVKSIFKNSGNKFSFTKKTKDKKGTVYFAYAGYTKKNNQLSFTIIKSKKGKKKDSICIATADVNHEKTTLPDYTPVDEDNPEAISWKEANKRINNWIDDSKRNTWIKERFKIAEKPKNAIFYAFYIHDIDFKYGIEHDCYLALRKISDNYQAELIIVNTETKQAVSLPFKKQEIANLENLTAPVPPFDPFG